MTLREEIEELIELGNAMDYYAGASGRQYDENWHNLCSARDAWRQAVNSLYPR